MKKVSIYNSSWGTFGGGEKYICTVAESLSKLPSVEVTLLLDKPHIARENLVSFYNIGFERVHVQNIVRSEVPKFLRQADLGIVTSNVQSFGTHAKRNIYILQIPYYKITPATVVAKTLKEGPKEGAKDVLRLSLLRDAKNADCILVYSEFVKKILSEYHGIETEILYPAIDDFSMQTQRQPVVLSVGRFFRGLYNDKRLDVLIESFKKLSRRLGDSSWQYRLVGSCSQDTASQQYLASLKRAAKGFPISFHVNAPYDELRRHYNEATIFWHAAGYGVDEMRYPERMEHFGMSTVEAMSAQCIPIVINKGGQKEIVVHGESGYVWNTIDQLVDCSLQVINNPSIVPGLRRKARERFTNFDHDHFNRRLLSLVEVYLS